MQHAFDAVVHQYLALERRQNRFHRFKIKPLPGDLRRLRVLGEEEREFFRVALRSVDTAKGIGFGLLLAFLGLAAVLAILGVGVCQAAEDGDGWQTLFDGTSLEAWQSASGGPPSEPIVITTPSTAATIPRPGSESAIVDRADTGWEDS